METDWNKIVWANIQEIVRAAESVAGENVVCALMDVDDARSTETTSPGVMQLVADTRLQGAVPLTDPEGKRYVACLPIPLDRLLASLSKHEETSGWDSRIKVKGGLVTWVVCLDQDRRVCLDIHLASPEHN